MINLILMGLFMMIWGGVVYYQLSHFVPFTREDYEQDMIVVCIVGFYLLLIGIV